MIARISNEEIADALDGLETVGGSSDRLVIRLAMERLRAGGTEGWFKWGGGKMPVEYGTPLRVLHRDGDEYSSPAGVAHASDWSHDNSGGDIVAYRVVAK